MNQPVYKCSDYNRFGHSYPIYFYKLKGSKDINPEPLRTTNAPKPK